MFAAIGVLMIIAYGDVRTRRIPNPLTAVIAILGLVRMLIADDSVGTIHTIEASAAVFAASFLLFWRGIFGGGDAKLVTAMVLIISCHDLFGFLILMSVCGGALAFAILARHSLSSLSWRLLRFTGKPVASGNPALDTPLRPSTVPYGVAIATAGVVTLILEISSLQ